jgi:serine/threonine protein kinase
VLHPSPDWWIKISDFGITKRAQEESTALRTRIGTRGYLAPEVIGLFTLDDMSVNEPTQTYTSAVDIWALGEITFRMITRNSVFAEPRDLYNYVVVNRPFPRDLLSRCNASSICCDFVEFSMGRSARERPTADVIASHQWFADLRSLSRGNTLEHTE